MGNPWIATQLVVGNEERAATSWEGIVRAIARAREAARIDALILWPSAEPGLTGELARACRSLCIRPLLWFPVLSDAPGVPQRTESLVENCAGSRGQGTR